MTRPPKTRRALRRFAILAAGLPLGACGADRTVTGSTYPPDYRQRHPIVLAEAPRTLDVFVVPRAASIRVSARMSSLSRSSIGATARAAHGADAGRVRRELGAHRTLEAVREALESGGIPGGYLAVSTYLVADPRAASAIRLSFQRLQAKVAGKCGLWPQDLGVSNMSADFNNGPYWNLGCALQANVAAQVADPIDLVRGRQEGRIDTLRRSKDIENLRQGKDPSTQYRSDEKGRSTPRSAIDGVAGKGWRACLIRPIAATS